MPRLFAHILLFLLSLLTITAAPTNLLWYVAILVTEFSWAFFIITILMIAYTYKFKKFRIANILLGMITLSLFIIPIVEAVRLSANLILADKPLLQKNASKSPFNFGLLFTGYYKKRVSFKTFTYDSSHNLSLDFYPAAGAGKKPCIMVVHGGSWAGGNSRQLPELNSELARQGYHVAAINYRLAPANLFPAPINDLAAAIRYLKSNAQKLSIDSSRFILLGRSAGGQIVLSAGDLLNDRAVKGVISFYGPADMVWGYANPSNPLVLDSRKVMEDYLGGSYAEAPRQYINSSATLSANRQTPPTLLIYGKNDPLVSYKHGERLSARLDEAGVAYTAIYLPWATHGFDWTLNGPGGQLSTWAVLSFLQSIVPVAKN